MHGAGNDYVYVDCTAREIEDPASLAVRVSDRHFGVGSDGLVLICRSDVADFRMRMFNSDGSEAQMCGNASRCVGKYVYDKGMTNRRELSLETLAGVKHLALNVEGGRVSTVRVDMGIPELEAVRIPVLASHSPVIGLPVEVDGERFEVTCVSMGNPHAVIFVNSVENADVHRIGRAIELHPLFPERTNVEFIEIVNRAELKMRVWERGAGETLACGTGACAAVVAAALNNLADPRATVHLTGGDLEIEWAQRVCMTGGAVTVFEGELL